MFAAFLPKVLLDTHFRRMDEIFAPDDLARLKGMATILWGRDPSASPQFIEEIRAEVEAVIAADWRYGAVTEFPRLRAILEVSGKLPDPETLDYATCFARGVRVLSCAPAFGPAVAEMALALTLAAGRDLCAGDAAMRRGTERWGWDGNAQTSLLFDQSIGFIGYGSLGRALQPLLAPFRCPISVYDPGMTNAYLETQGVTPLSLERLLETSRIVYVLAAPTPNNRGLLSRALLSRLMPGALVVLVSRAHLVDFDALTEMLHAGRCRAGIDVFPDEPLPAEHPIRSAPGVVLSAHRAGGDAAGFQAIGRMVVNDLEAILSGLPPRQMQSAMPEVVGPRP